MVSRAFTKSAPSGAAAHRPSLRRRGLKRVAAVGVATVGAVALAMATPAAAFAVPIHSVPLPTPELLLHTNLKNCDQIAPTGDVLLLGSGGQPQDASNANGTGELHDGGTLLDITIHEPNSVTAIIVKAGDDSNVYEQGLTQVGALSIGTGTVPRESSATLTLRSSHTSRRKMGRLLLPGPRNPSMVNANGTWVTSGSYYTNIATFADALLAGKDIGIGGVDGHLSTRVYSRVAHIQGVGAKTTDINAYTIQPRVRWLRRRVTAP